VAGHPILANGGGGHPHFGYWDHPQAPRGGSATPNGQNGGGQSLPRPLVVALATPQWPKRGWPKPPLRLAWATPMAKMGVAGHSQGLQGWLRHSGWFNHPQTGLGGGSATSNDQN
jgi:hypothetical protein